jgi:DNA polymerase-1
VRSVFVPREGYSFVVCDYDSIEIRLLAYYMGNEAYRELVAHNDPHAWMASKIWGGDPADYAKGGPNDKKRGLAKNILFAICYGAGAPRVMNMLLDAGMPASREEAKQLIATIKKSLPGFFKLNKRIRDKIESVGYVETLFGRKQIVRPDKAYVGMNALIQGSAADVFKAGVVAVDKAIAEWDAHPILFVHDEIVLEAPTEHADEILHSRSARWSRSRRRSRRR